MLGLNAILLGEALRVPGDFFGGEVLAMVTELGAPVILDRDRRAVAATE